MADAADDVLQEMEMKLQLLHDDAREWHRKDDSMRNQLAVDAAANNLELASQIWMADCEYRPDLFEQAIKHTAHWSKQFCDWGGYRNGYASEVHGEANRIFKNAYLKLKGLSAEIVDIQCVLCPLAQFGGGSSGKYHLKEVIKEGYCSEQRSSETITKVAASAKASLNMMKPSFSASADVNVDAMSSFQAACVSTFWERETTKSFEVDMGKPCYMYTASMHIVTADGIKHVFSSKSVVQSPVRILQTSFAAPLPRR